MKRLSILLIVALLASMVSGCRYAIVEGDTVRALGLSAVAEGRDLFDVGTPDLSFLDDEPVNLTPSPSPTPKGYKPESTPEADPTATPKPTEPASTKMPKVKLTPDPEATPTPEAPDETIVPEVVEETISPEPVEETPAPIVEDMTPSPTKMPKMTVTPTPMPTPSPTEEVIIGLHSRDEEGENKVRKLQERLIELGYLDGEPDGLFGSRTLKALKAFQRDKELEETGVLDEATKDALYPRPETTTAPEDVLYAEGAVGSSIRVIHERLRLYGFSDRPVLAEYVEETADEIMAFQFYAVKYYGTEFDDPAEAVIHPHTPAISTAAISDEEGIPEMPVLAPEATLRPFHATDGVVTQNLYDYLVSNRFPVYRETVQRGDEGEEVERLQRRLKVLDYFYNDVTGTFDNLTDAALKGFQRENRLQETGIADPETQRVLYSTRGIAAPKADRPYYIKVSIDDQRVYVYRWLDGDYNMLIKSMICSTGLGSSTPKGVFISTGHRDSRWHYFIDFNCWAQYAFVITGNILFHSVLYSSKNEGSLRVSSVNNLGHKASHGCVRLRVEDARWIYEHCGKGQVIEVY